MPDKQSVVQMQQTRWISQYASFQFATFGKARDDFDKDDKESFIKN